MKRFTLIVCFSLLLLIIATPVTATSTSISGDVISSISPTGGATNTYVIVTINGNNFTTVQGSARLEKSGDKITASTCGPDPWTPTQIKCRFDIPKNADTGTWDVVVVKGYDDTLIEKDDMFTITDPMTLTSISPTSGRNDDDDVDFTIKGKNFEDNIAKVYLLNKDDETIDAKNVDRESSTEITGTFDLEDEEEGKYDVCVKDDFGAIECDLDFEILTSAEGSIEISSSPSGASIFIDNIANGTTPNTVKNLLVGSYKIVLKKSGYEDWGKVVTVEEEETVEVDANLYAIRTAVPTTAQTPVPTTVPRTTRTTVKSTIKIPTTWVDTPTTTAASPLDPAIIIGAVGLVFLAFRKP
jgi:hypothetical protein